MKNKNILIIGGTGSWANILIQKLLKAEAAQIIIYARSESKMVAVKQQYPDGRVKAFLGDIRDKSRLMDACKDCDFIFHLAALKHVPVCEAMPTEAILTNVIGTQNVIDCAIANKVAKVIYVSTDKAVTPECTYGCTKLLGEKLIQAADGLSKDTRFITFRSGNLMGSAGSVIPLFIRQIKEDGVVKLTDKQMNRFFISIPRVTDLLIQVASRSAGGEIFLPRMDSIWIYDIAKYLLSKQGLDETQIKVTGLRPGEKINEYMATEEEAKHIYQVDSDLYMIAKEDRHAWVINDFVKKEEKYKTRSQDAVVEYEAAVSILSEVC